MIKKTKVITLLIGGLILLTSLGISSKTYSQNISLYNCYKSKGITWSSIYDRAVVAAKYGIWEYKGTSEQNNLLANYICPEEEILGYGVATDFQKTLRSSVNSTQSTIPVSSLELKDGTTLSMDNLGSKVFLTLEPGRAKEEIVMCTGITASPAAFTGCSRGLAFSGTSTSEVAANKNSHGAGSIIVMSNVHYVYEQLADLDTAQTITAPYTFTSSSPNVYYQFPIVSSTSYTGLPTQNGDLATKYYVDTVGAGGFTAVNASTTYGLQTFGTSPETVGINASSTTGMSFDSNGALYQKTSSTTGIESDSNGIKLNTSTLVNLIATSTPTANKIVQADESGKIDDGWLSNNILQMMFGDGSDGNIDINSGSFSSGPITNNQLTRDAYFNNLTLSGGDLDPNGFKIFVKETLTIDAGYKIDVNGNAGGNGGNGGNSDATTSHPAGGTGGTAGTARNTNTLFGGIAGVAGGAGADGALENVSGANSADGNSGNSSTKGILENSGKAGVAGGAGGDNEGGSYPQIGGTAGAGGSGGTNSGTIYNKPNTVLNALTLFDFLPSLTQLQNTPGAGGGSGGGSGAGGKTSTGDGPTGGGGGGAGGSGSTAGIMIISAKIIVNNGYIQAIGGAGGNGGNGGTGGTAPYASVDAGGGGGGAGGAGGNGGVIVLIYASKSGSGLESVTGGAGGTKGSGGIANGDGDPGLDGNDGNTGEDGIIYEYKI